jgi:2-(1,2-epoxy-1,2-dihydrophenyl)acetyl-CoA isomerase
VDRCVSNDIVQVDFSDGVATFTLDRPKKHNAYSPEMGKEILSGLNAVDRRDDVRCVVFEGSGDAFSAGGDIDSMAERLEANTPAIDNAERLMDGANEVVRRVFRCPLPTIALIDGVAVGSGASIALSCDLILASERGSMGFNFRRLGLTVDTGVSYLLPRLVGANVAKELVYTGELVDAERGVEIGLFNHVFPTAEFDENAKEIIDTIASGPPKALRQSKRLIEDGHHQPLEAAIDDEALAQAALQDGHDHAEGVWSFQEQREPEYGDE